MSEPIASIEVRFAVDGDIPQLLRLMAAHANYERAPFNDHGLAERVRATLISRTRASCFVAVDRVALTETLVGYLTFAPEYSTWRGRDHLHMDTFFVDEGHRGRGVGAQMFDRLLAEATANGFDQIQWQTPDWNTDAMRFYERISARPQSKVRYTLSLDS